MSTNWKAILDDLYFTQIEMFITYTQHRKEATELGMPQEVLDRLDEEYQSVSSKIEQAMENAKLLMAVNN